MRHSIGTQWEGSGSDMRARARAREEGNSQSAALVVVMVCRGIDHKKQNNWATEEEIRLLAGFVDWINQIQTSRLPVSWRFSGTVRSEVLVDSRCLHP